MFQVLCWALVIQSQASHDIAGKEQNSNSQYGSEKDGAVPSRSACFSLAHTYILSYKMYEGQGCPRFDDLVNLHR